MHKCICQVSVICLEKKKFLVIPIIYERCRGKKRMSILGETEEEMCQSGYCKMLKIKNLQGCSTRFINFVFPFSRK